MAIIGVGHLLRGSLIFAILQLHFLSIVVPVTEIFISVSFR